MALFGRRLAVSVPDTLLEEKSSLREKTAKLGLLARACAVFGVDVVEVFGDPKGRGEAQTIRKVLEYLETPQYLRKRLYPLDETLRYAGMLPPLRIPSHKAQVPLGELRIGDAREGVMNGDGTVDIGLGAAPRLVGRAAPGGRVTVRVSSLNPFVAEPIQPGQAGAYWGYAVETKPVDEVLSDPRYPLKIATSRLGTDIADKLGSVRTLLMGAEGVKLIFGSPSRGLFDIVGRDLGRRVDFVLNLFPQQQVKSVRTEEAVFVGLGIVSLLSSQKA